MEITHVIRGEDWLPSLPLHILLYRALGWEETRPRFSHLPLILKPQGKGKLSKRDGDKMGFPVFPLVWSDPETGEKYRGYREDGYYPEAFLNLLAFLGWNPGTEQELFSLEEMVKSFSLERVVKSGSRFDPEKARWFNRQYLQQKSAQELARQLVPLLYARNISVTLATLVAIVEEIKERCDFVSDFWEQGRYFFEAPGEYDQKAVAKRWKPGIPEAVKEIADLFAAAGVWQAVPLKEQFSAFMNEKGWHFGDVMNALRICLVGGNVGPDLFRICELLGKNETVTRLRTALIKLGQAGCDPVSRPE